MQLIWAFGVSAAVVEGLFILAVGLAVAVAGADFVTVCAAMHRIAVQALIIFGAVSLVALVVMGINWSLDERALVPLIGLAGNMLVWFGARSYLKREGLLEVVNDLL